MANQNGMKRHPQIYIDHQVWTIQLDSHSQVGMKNATSTLSRTMIEVFRAYLDKFLKVFVDEFELGKTLGTSTLCFIEVKGSQFQT